MVQIPLSTQLSGSGFLFSDAVSLSKADDPPTVPLTQGQSGVPESLCCLFTWDKEPLFPPFSFGQKPFSFSFESTQKSSRYENLSVSGGEQNPPIARKVPPYGSHNPPRFQLQKVPLRRKNWTIAYHCCYSAISANTLFYPQKPPKIPFVLRGVDGGRRGRVHGLQRLGGGWVCFFSATCLFAEGRGLGFCSLSTNRWVSELCDCCLYFLGKVWKIWI